MVNMVQGLIVGQEHTCVRGTGLPSPRYALSVRVKPPLPTRTSEFSMAGVAKAVGTLVRVIGPMDTGSAPGYENL